MHFRFITLTITISIDRYLKIYRSTYACLVDPAIMNLYKIIIITLSLPYYYL